MQHMVHVFELVNDLTVEEAKTPGTIDSRVYCIPKRAKEIIEYNMLKKFIEELDNLLLLAEDRESTLFNLYEHSSKLRNQLKESKPIKGV